MSNGLVVIPPTAVTAVEFVDFWSRLYFDPRQELYDNNINIRPRTRESVMRLFEWKNGGVLSAAKTRSVERNYISNLEQSFPADVGTYLAGAPGTIWRIFWLHCLDQTTPIYDQHVHRAMTFIEQGKLEELDQFSDPEKVVLYLKYYRPFLARLFTGIDVIKTDKALWTFGKTLKKWPNLFCPTDSSVA